MNKSYQPKDIEQRVYERWEENGYFAPQGDGERYCIMIPPPNVTGSLHMGHGFNNTIMDTLIRFNRMQGRRTLWQPGTDHAGIATQMVVERQLEAEGKSRHDLGREAFIDRIWEWKKESGGNITRQLRRLGSSLDWQHERFTMDEGLSRAVQEVFVRLYEEGLIYRGKRLVNWDHATQTVLADDEVEVLAPLGPTAGNGARPLVVGDGGEGAGEHRVRVLDLRFPVAVVDDRPAVGDVRLEPVLACPVGDDRTASDEPVDGHVDRGHRLDRSGA